jgi:hypothetical protein
MTWDKSGEWAEADPAWILRELAAALVPLLRTYRKTSGMGELPEALSVIASTNGYQGGDAGHGGEFTIRFSNHGGAGSNEIIPNALDDEDENARTSEVILRACGDWEQAGLLCGLMEALEQVLPVFHSMPVADDEADG